MISQRTYAAATLILILGGATACASEANAHGDPKLMAEARITPDAARQIAQQTQSGTIKEWEVEREPGGSGLRYSFDIESGGQIHEVGVDAADGKILENVVESPEAEAREAREEANEKVSN